MVFNLLVAIAFSIKTPKIKLSARVLIYNNELVKAMKTFNKIVISKKMPVTKICIIRVIVIQIRNQFQIFFSSMDTNKFSLKPGEITIEAFHDGAPVI